MNRFTYKWMALAGALLAPAISYAQVSCTREGLKAATDLYIAAQTKGDTADLPLAMGLGYVENFKTININEGLIKKAMKIDHHRSLLDTATCQTFTEVIVTDKANPYVLGTRLRTAPHARPVLVVAERVAREREDRIFQRRNLID